MVTVGLCLRLFCGSVGYCLVVMLLLAVACGCCTWVCFGFADWLFFVFLWFWFLLVCVISLVLIVLLCDWFVVYVALAVCWYGVGLLCIDCGEHFVF